MGFEAKVMAVVEDVLGKDDMNGFAFGTLFVNCFPKDATRLLRRLNKEFGGKVQKSTVGPHMEYAFDFTA